jgi:protein-S-isoprenylcysteine O-methyltransferase Ste14
MGHSAMDHSLMNDLVPWLFPVLWLLWGVYWWAQSRGVKANVWAESAPSRLMHVVPLVVAALLLVWDLPLFGLNERILPRSMATFWVGFILAVAGLLFTVWARRHLATNWSGDVTIKEGHELITSGPYGWVRHPIYTGLLLGFVGSAAAVGEWRGLVALIVVGLALWRKLRMEERGMRQLFGERYVAYEERVSALIPFII